MQREALSRMPRASVRVLSFLGDIPNRILWFTTCYDRQCPANRYMLFNPAMVLTGS
jgi:hypothetical protein